MELAMPKKPETMKEVLRELVERCDYCGSRNILVLNYREHKKKKPGIWEELGDMFFPPSKKEAAERNKDGLEIEYWCRRCDDEVVQFYDRKTCEAFRTFMKNKYGSL
jgi:DNA-directed RNA polymerase subunit RPC12/RpoP